MTRHLPRDPTECPRCVAEANLIDDTVGYFPADKHYNEGGYAWGVCVVHKCKWVIGPEITHLRNLEGVFWPQVEPAVRLRSER